jgi:hypothetical protein
VIKNPSISYCTTCRERLHHLQQTLPHNLAKHNRADVEFIVLDYNSEDGLSTWISDTFQSEIASGQLKCLRTTEPQCFHMAHAKNVVHRAASNDVVCNLDADNYVTAEFTAYLLNLFEQSESVIASGFGETGFFGRVALTKRWFERLGGYDENFHGWGYDDEDLIARAQAMGLTVHQLPPQFETVIAHPRADGWNESRERHVQQSRDNIAKGILTANSGRKWGVACLTSLCGKTHQPYAPDQGHVALNGASPAAKGGAPPEPARQDR